MNRANLHVFNSGHHLQVIRVGGYQVAIPEVCLEFFLHLICSFICKCDHHNTVSHFPQRNILGIADKSNTRNHRVGFAGTCTGANYNVLFRRSMLNFILLKIKLALFAKLFENRFLRTVIFSIMNYKGSSILAKRLTQYAHGAVKAHEHIINGSSRRNMVFLFVKCDFDIIPIPY